MILYPDSGGPAELQEKWSDAARRAAAAARKAKAWLKKQFEPDPAMAAFWAEREARAAQMSQAERDAVNRGVRTGVATHLLTRGQGGMVVPLAVGAAAYQAARPKLQKRKVGAPTYRRRRGK